MANRCADWSESLQFVSYLADRNDVKDYTIPLQIGAARTSSFWLTTSWIEFLAEARCRAPDIERTTMWCGQCGQDGPAVPATDDPDAIICLNCRATYTEAPTTYDGRLTRVDSSHSPGKSSGTAWREPDVVEPPPIVDDDDFWFEPEDLHEDVAAVPLMPTKLPDQVSQSERRRRRRRRRHRRSALICWTMLSIGVALFVCGASLIGWSLLEERDELWNIGAPIVLAGQATFLIGLVLQLDGIWHQSRAATRNLDELDERLTALQALQTGELNEQGDPAHAFYQHMAEGASPQMLLTDLKGQLDIIADRLAKQDKQVLRPFAERSKPDM